MHGKITITQAGDLRVHTYTAPEDGWQVNSHMVELSSQLVVIDAQYLLPHAREVLAYADQLHKPISRLYISHYHPDHLLGAVVFSAPIYALGEVSAKIGAVGDRVAREEHEKLGAVVADRAVLPKHVQKTGVETIEETPIDFIHIQHAETQDALMVGFSKHGILITQDLVYNRVHAMVGERAFEAWDTALESKKRLEYDKVLPGHGAPGGKDLYERMQQYLSTAREMFTQSVDGDDMKNKMMNAFPGYGGIGMLDQQKRFLFPVPLLTEPLRRN